MANRGYAVLQVNYRGSTGYGKNFLNAGNRQWGRGIMQHDLTDAVRWAIEKGIADPTRVCIFGASYGGYATLSGLAFTPELYACGVSMVGVSNVGTFLKSIPPYWRPLRIDFVNRVGDAEANATLNQEISPMYHVRNIRAPLLIGQGANDPRVPKRESDQMFAAMKEKGLDVEYILYPDEGHGFVRPDNRLDFYSRIEQFLSKHLGGRAEPLLQLKGSTAKVVTKV
jgi:dipeptidyl aminopeptidase/acylaminoacyl peptidase